MAVNDLHLHPEAAVPGFASLRVCMDVPMYLEIAPAVPPTPGHGDMPRHGVDSRGKCHLPPPFHLIPCRGGGEKDFAYRLHDGAACDKKRIATGGERITAARRGSRLLFGPGIMWKHAAAATV